MQDTERAPLRDFDIRITSDAYIRSPLWIVGPRSYFSDRAVPQLEISAVPARTMDAADWLIKGRIAPGTTADFRSRRERLPYISRAAKRLEMGSERYYLDLRRFGLSNWSHCLNQGLPLAIAVRDYLKTLGQTAPIVILDKTISAKILQLFDALKLEYICSNSAVTAPLITLDYSNPSLIHKKSREFVASLTEDIAAFIHDVDTKSKKVFLNRKTFRSLVNNKEIVDLLTQQGFQEVFMEDLSIAEQFAILLRATDVVAIHGAALAPLLFRTAEHGPFRLIEINTPGHIVPFFRDMVEELPCTYRLVRGIPNANMVARAFADVENPSMQFTHEHSLKPFAVDPLSLRVALDRAHDNDFPASIIAHPC